MRQDYLETIRSEQGTFSASLRCYKTADYLYVWCRSRLVIEIARLTGTGRVTYIINGTSYTSDNSGVLLYDATADARDGLSNAGKRFELDVDCGTDSMALECVAIDGIMPSQLIMPSVGNKLDKLEPQEGAPDDITQVMPPNVIYTHPSVSGDMLIEIRGMLEWENLDWFYKHATAPVIVADNTLRVRQGLSEAQFLNAHGDNQLDFKIFPVTPLLNCDMCVALSWQSLCGVEKTAVWKLRDIRQTSEHTGLLAMGDGYEYMAGGGMMLTAYIEGLDAYSYAYYADIFRSPRVTLLDIPPYANVFANEYPEWAVEVVPQDITVPLCSTGGTYTLEIQLRCKHYDTV